MVPQRLRTGHDNHRIRDDARRLSRAADLSGCNLASVVRAGISSGDLLAGGAILAQGGSREVDPLVVELRDGLLMDHTVTL